MQRIFHVHEDKKGGRDIKGHFTKLSYVYDLTKLGLIQMKISDVAKQSFFNMATAIFPCRKAQKTGHSLRSKRASRKCILKL